MKKIIKKINIENILCLFIILSPILDIISFLYRNIFETNISLTTFLRPIIPICVIMYLFLKKDKKFKKATILIGVIYIIYAIIHIYIFNKIKTGSSFGDIKHETQYLINYSFMILNLLTYLYIFRNHNTEKLKRSILIAISIYIISILTSILTETSSYTYKEEKMGYKGWIESGNSVSAIFILSMFILMPYIKSKKYKKITIVLITLVGIYLMTLIGTRVGLYGFLLVTFIYVILEIGFKIWKDKSMNKKLIIGSVVGFLSILLIITIIGSKTIERRNYLKEKESEIVDIEKQKKSHITGDLLEIKKQIDKNALQEGYMNEAEKQSIQDLYNIAQKYNIKNTDLRMQQFIYNVQLVKNQNNFIYKLFGNGMVTNYRELVMEMEIVSIAINFGIIGFLLYLGPFLAISIYALYIGIKERKRIDAEYVFTWIGVNFAFILSLFSGYVFFNISTSMIIIVLYVTIWNKIKELKDNKQENVKEQSHLNEKELIEVK